MTNLTFEVVSAADPGDKDHPARSSGLRNGTDIQESNGRSLPTHISVIKKAITMRDELDGAGAAQKLTVNAWMEDSIAIILETCMEE